MATEFKTECKEEEPEEPIQIKVERNSNPIEHYKKEEKPDIDSDVVVIKEEPLDYEDIKSDFYDANVETDSCDLEDNKELISKVEICDNLLKEENASEPSTEVKLELDDSKEQIPKMEICDNLLKEENTTEVKYDLTNCKEETIEAICDNLLKPEDTLDYTDEPSYITTHEAKRFIKKKHSKQCDLCDFSTKWEKNLRVHILEEHCVRKVLICQQCDFRTYTYLDLRKHQKKHLKYK